MTNRDDGGPAFPIPFHVWGDPKTGYNSTGGDEGMTLRDWFAGQALVGLMAMPVLPPSEMVPLREWRYEDFAESAYSAADAMLRERAKGGE